MLELLTRLRALLAGGATVLAVGSGWFLVGPPDGAAPTIRVAAFNIQVFGRAKLAKEDVVDVLVRTARRFDVLVVQEVRDAEEGVADAFLEKINDGSDVRYAMHEGPREGRTSSKEQYVVYYRTPAIQLVAAEVADDSLDVFEREPLLVTLRADSLDFQLVVIHVKPDSAYQELRALEGLVADLMAANPGERDVIVLGDLNADCRYLDEDRPDLPLSGERFHWVIGNDQVTTTASECTYDRIILTDETLAGSYVQGSASVFRFDTEFGLTDRAFVRSVSDHYPVYAEFLTAGVDADR
ncbi:MAG: endonuclease/exonuclease/phosphatase family protein [Gemmatimonadota bacterium]|nr:endonuclease/exonuclease/phosphatase family protein [Gemmatimonadota bacterium]MDH5759124.1 endonuclease/exonuclease/phosphatase family protein [Gemmatimonadota bacterium]